jgi:hypothetical protein
MAPSPVHFIYELHHRQQRDRLFTGMVELSNRTPFVAKFAVKPISKITAESRGIVQKT